MNTMTLTPAQRPENLVGALDYFSEPVRACAKFEAQQLNRGIVNALMELNQRSLHVDQLLDLAFERVGEESDSDPLRSLLTAMKEALLRDAGVLFTVSGEVCYLMDRLAGKEEAQ